jgi:hypothetical protein
MNILTYKKYYENNKEKIAIAAKKRRKINEDIIKAKRRNYLPQRNEKRKIKYHNDIQYKLREALRSRCRIALRKGFKSGSVIRDLGCDINKLKIYLESKFQPGMSWDNWSREGWHIDHIKPLAFFDLNDRNQFLQACHYTNLQPLWAKDNIAKSDKII